MGGKGHTLLLDLTQAGQGKHLKPAGICQDGSVPPHKPVQSAHLSHHIVPGPQVQMIGVGQLDLAADVLEVKGTEPSLGHTETRPAGHFPLF